MSAGNASFLAIDLGAESGRGVIGRIANDRLTLTQVHRFPNRAVRMGDRLHWDIPFLHQEIKNAIAAAHQQENALAGVAVDSWGVDFGLLAADGSLLGNPVHYRDNRTDGIPEQVFNLIPREQVFAQTGIQIMQINTLYQLFSLVRANAPVLHAADRLLMIGELMIYLLTGAKVAEFTNATTSQCLNPATGTWAADMLAKLGIPTHLFPDIVPSGTRVGQLRTDIAEETGAGQLPVFVPAVHDTGSAIAAVPLEGPSACYISSGTWSLMGIETDTPIINAASLAANYTNEGGVGGRFRFLKNIMGMWLLQECRRSWEREGAGLDYAGIQALAEQSAPLVTLINPDDPGFFAAGQMPARIREYARGTGQPVPTAPGAMARCILESLALRYRQVLEQLQILSGRHLDTIHIVGGGAQNTLLNQLTADATGCTIVAGPIEATSCGNIICQAIAAGVLNNISEGRELVRKSFAPGIYTPRDNKSWSEAYERFTLLTKYQ